MLLIGTPKVSALVGITMRVSSLGIGSRTQYTLLIYLSGKGSAKDSSGQALVGGETVFYDHRGGVVAEVLSDSETLICLIKLHYVCRIVS